MQICILSDSHDNRYCLDIAVSDAKSRGAVAIIHCGDVVAPTTLRVLQKYGLPVHVIHGNNMGDVVATAALSHDPNSVVQYYGADASLRLANRHIFIVHYPHYARAMATTGDYDLVCCGHDHKTEITPIDNMKNSQTILVNPGTVGGIGADPTYILADLARMEFEICAVPIKPEQMLNKPHATPHI